MIEFITSIPGIVSVAGVVALFLIPRIFHTRVERSGLDYRVVMQILVSVIILAAGLFVVLSKDYGPETEKWAFGVMGTVVGYWLNV